MNNSYKSALAGFIVGTTISLGAMLMGGCTNPPKTAQVVKSSVQLADDMCVLLKEVAPENKTGETICATENELRPFVPLIVAGRARPVDAGARADH